MLSVVFHLEKKSMIFVGKETEEKEKEKRQEKTKRMFM